MSTSSTSDTPLFAGTATESGEASSTRGLFPTQSGSRGNSNDDRAGSPNVYYLVFLGILVLFLILAGCLALRAVRMRRRYRTATQIALARGEPIPQPVIDPYWRLAGLTTWTSEGFDRLGNLESEMNRRRERERDKEKLKLKPKIYDCVVWENENRLQDGLDSAEPISIQSLLLSSPPPSASSNPPQVSSPRPLFGFRQRSSPSPSEVLVPQITQVNKNVSAGEPVQMGVIIQMPVPPDQQHMQDQQRYGDDEEERVGWEMGMELGVWQGQIRNEAKDVRDSSESYQV
ncbi:hypothetical protein L486_06158 [Kwoniella mangroviensis CBS 10435]|uniref:Uncharacterized protein n=1 Tax=Kwoniella mangroviensis CBS 10435 TaxID=1331196 RepID=A0A1B9IL41_9TREE|nr:uncharacterized protein I203_05866 [Kwoniella mangroviensis CBS 8507]OCF56217.1 hypothetical protein L486_06158 [Kwoniella mangroviensis CBS 10435]OCF65124.1 hypothetical protein I203_05866 [Kwoniella mangroviensis CBS 8507]OCF78965.1 hypothetical protein I204_00909 [Kwoniella mangroviensis CBS 8886]